MFTSNTIGELSFSFFLVIHQLKAVILKVVTLNKVVTQVAIQEATLNREATPALVIRAEAIQAEAIQAEAIQAEAIQAEAIQAEAIQAEAIQAVATLNKVDILVLTPELDTLNQEVVIPEVIKNSFGNKKEEKLKLNFKLFRTIWQPSQPAIGFRPRQTLGL